MVKPRVQAGKACGSGCGYDAHMLWVAFGYGVPADETAVSSEGSHTQSTNTAVDDALAAGDGVSPADQPEPTDHPSPSPNQNQAAILETNEEDSAEAAPLPGTAGYKRGVSAKTWQRASVILGHALPY